MPIYPFRPRLPAAQQTLPFPRRSPVGIDIKPPLGPLPVPTTDPVTGLPTPPNPMGSMGVVPGQTRNPLIDIPQEPFLGYKGPPLNTEAALEGLRSAPPHPLLELTRLASEARTGQRPDQPSYQYGQGLEQYVQGQLAPQRAQTERISAAIAGLHPAVQAEAEATARRGAYPAVASAQGVIGAAETSADARVNEAILQMEQGNIESAREIVGPALNGLIDLYSSYQGIDTEEGQAIRNYIIQILQSAGRKGAL